MKLQTSVRLALATALGVTAFSVLGAPSTGVVEKMRMDSKILFEHLVSGPLTDLNGRYKLRVTETVYAPGGHIGPHLHAGPGVRLVLSGELTYVQAEKTTIYKTGDYIYESGAVSHTAYNSSNVPVHILNFEILPADWCGPSPVPVPDQPLSDPTPASGAAPAGQEPRVR